MAHRSSDDHSNSGIPGESRLFAGARLPASILLLTGPAGSGKTMYCRQFLKDGLFAGDHCIWVSLNPAFTEKEFAALLQEDQGKCIFINPSDSRGRPHRGNTASLILKRLQDGINLQHAHGATVRVVLDSLTNLMAVSNENAVVRFVADLYSILKGAQAMAILTLNTAVPAGVADTLGSLVDGTLQIKIEDEESELARSIRLLAVKGVYHTPKWVKFQIKNNGSIDFAATTPGTELVCKLCQKPITGTPAMDSDSPFHPSCLDTYRKLSDIYGSSMIYVVPSGVVNANFFFIDIVGLSDPSLSVEKQIKKIETLNRLISSCDAFAKTPRDKKIMLPTGDGMAVGFMLNPELPLQLGIQLHHKLKQFNRNSDGDRCIGVRIGLSSGPVFVVSDINNNQNVWGPGIIIARRVMDIGDDQHILLTGNLAEELINLKDEYRAVIKPISDGFMIKHGQMIKIYSAYSDDFGNPKMPTKMEHGGTSR